MAKLKTAQRYDIITFAGTKWYVIDPAVGYIFSAEPIGNKIFSTYGNTGFDPDSTDTSLLSYYLNHEYLESLSQQEKMAIQMHNWGIGRISQADGGALSDPPKLTLEAMKLKENSVKVNAKIGLFSLSEWRYHSEEYNRGIGQLPRPNSKQTFFLITAVDRTTAQWLVYDYDYYGGKVSQSTTNSNGVTAIRPAIYLDPEINLENGIVVYNDPPSVSLGQILNSTLYENDTLPIEGSATDADNGDIVNVRYQINALPAKAIATGISDGNTPISFDKSLTFKASKLYDGPTAITSALAEGVVHKLKVWAEDDKGGKSTVAERTFYVVPNRPPKLTINPFVTQSDLINADKVTFTGTTSDRDGNDVVVSYKLNSGLATEVYRGKDGDWSFDLLLSALKDGENTIVVETVDSYNFKTSLTRKLNKQANLTPLAKSVQRYTIVPPAGTAQGVLMWIERDATQDVTVEISMTNGTEQEQFKPMTLDSSGPANLGTVEDFFKFRADVPAEKIAIKLSWTGDKPIFKVSGALTQ